MALAVPVRAAPSPFPPSCVLCYSEAIFIIIIIYPLTARVVGAPQMISQPISSIFPCSPLPSRTWRMQVCPFPDVVFPPLPLSALPSSRYIYNTSEQMNIHAYRQHHLPLLNPQSHLCHSSLCHGLRNWHCVTGKSQLFISPWKEDLNRLLITETAGTDRTGTGWLSLLAVWEIWRPCA